jgi:hypothetical protein
VLTGQIRRSPKFPLPSQPVINKRSIYAKGFPLESTTIDSVSQYFAAKGYHVQSVQLRTFHAKDKGTFFVKLSSSHHFLACMGEKVRLWSSPSRPRSRDSSRPLGT